MRKAICYLVTIVFIVTLAGCISWPDTSTVVIESDIPIDTNNMPLPDPEELEFFMTIEEAVVNNDLEDLNSKYIDEVITLFENNEFAVLFFWNSVNGDAIFYAMKFMKKEIDGITQYSKPFYTTSIPWNGMHKLSIKRGKLDDIGEIRVSITRDVLRLFRIDNTKNFFWGLSQTERVKTLRIEGQLVTEVIEIELNGEIAYFWYFEDLQTDKKPVFKDLRTYTEGEFIITMDE